MDRAGTGDRPVRWRSVEDGATPTDIAAFEDRLLAVDGPDYIQHADLVGWPRQLEPATHTLGGGNQPGLRQLGEHLGQELLGHALQLGERTHAGLAAIALLIGQVKQAMDPVLHASAV
ncbi:hypothetical protein D9M71_645350 [compost metagenome]